MEYKLQLKGKFLFELTTNYSFEYADDGEDRQKLLKQSKSSISKKLKSDLRNYIGDYDSTVLFDIDTLNVGSEDILVVMLNTRKDLSEEFLNEFKFNYNDFASASSYTYVNGTSKECCESLKVTCNLITEESKKCDEE